MSVLVCQHETFKKNVFRKSAFIIVINSIQIKRLNYIVLFSFNNSIITVLNIAININQNIHKYSLYNKIINFNRYKHYYFLIIIKKKNTNIY